MKRFVFRGSLLLAVLLVVVLLLAWLARPAVPSRPDVLLITIDTLRADHLGAYGYAAARTPNIDRLAAEGTVFLQATTPFPRTTPGLASLLTGLWPQHHGSREVTQPIGDVTTLAQVLKKQGYVTLGVSATGAASPHQHLDRGFDQFLDYRELKPPLAKLVTERTLQLVATAPADQPLLLWVHYIDPHFPYIPPADWPDQPAAEGCRALIDDVSRSSWRIAEAQGDRDGMSSRVLADCVALYDAEIAYADSEVGRLLAGLEAAGRRQRAVIVFTADHGENLGEDGLFFEHGPSVSDASLRVPLIFAGAGIPQRVDRGVFRLEDVTPTLLSLLRVPAAERPAMDGVDSSSRLARWAGLASWHAQPVALAESGSSLLPNSFRWVYSGRVRELHCYHAGRFSLCSKPGEVPRLYDHEADPELKTDLSAQLPQERAQLLAVAAAWPAEQVRQRTVRTPRFKLVEYPRWRGGYRRVLYDLAADPGETTDVKQRFPNDFQRLQRTLSSWTAQLPASAGGERTPEQIQALRALGYIQ